MNPLEQDLSQLKETDLEAKIQELTKKYGIVAKTGNQNLLTQVHRFLIIYKAELSQRHLDRTRADYNGDMDQLINVD